MNVDPKRIFALLNGEECTACRKSFTEKEWDNRHLSGEEEYHETCCPDCLNKIVSPTHKEDEE